MPGTNSNEAQSDELDLMELLRKFVVFVRNSAKYILGFGFLGLLLGILVYWISPFEYSSKMILHSYFLTNQEHIQVITGWNDLLKHKDRATLARILNCDVPTIEKLNKITADEIVKGNPDGNLNGFIVTALVKDTSILSKIQAGVKYGLENTEYVRERLAVKKSNLSIIIKRVKDEIKKLDSVKATVERDLTVHTAGKSSPFLIDVGDINIEIITLNEKLLTYQEEDRFLSAVQVLQNFNRLNRPIGPKKRTLFPLGLLVGVALGYIFYLLIYLSKKFHRMETK